MRKRSLAFIIFIIVLGAIIGTTLGEILGFALPEGVVKELFLRTALIGIEPTTINLGVFTFTLGFTLKLNGIGFIGIAIAAYLLRWYRHERHY